jgi:hypothetical protein
VKGLTELEVKFSYPNLVDKSLCISPVRASGTIAFFRKGEYPSVFRKRPSLKSEKSVIYPLLDAFGVGSDVTTAKPSVANEGADKRLSRTTYRFVGHKVRALPEYPN